MFRYAIKRIIRGKSLFLALFLSVALSATLFAGIIQGANAVGVTLLDTALDSAYVDIVSSAIEKNITKTRIYDVENVLGVVEGVDRIDHFIRWTVELQSPSLNGTTESMVIALPDDSTLYDGITGTEVFEKDKIYVDIRSSNSTALLNYDEVTLKVETYLPYNPPGFEMRYFNHTIGGSVALDESTFLIASGRYNLFLRSLILASQETSRRPAYTLILMSEETLQDLLGKIFAEQRRPTKDQVGEALISLDRDSLLNPWDISGSRLRVREINEEINANGAEYFYLPRNYLDELLDGISSTSDRMKNSTLLVAAPVFFTAWYLGITISEVLLGLRRREIGLLFTRGMTHRQVLYMLIFEAGVVGVLGGLIGVFTGAAIIPLVIPGISFTETFRTISFITLGVTLVFSSVIALLSVYRPTKKALEVNIVDALKEHQTDEEDLGPWLEPLIAFLLGGYKFAMLILNLTVEQFRPTTDNMIISLLYSTWWGSDYLLGFISPILFFWGFTKLFLQYAPWFQSILTKLAGLIAGDAAEFAALSSRRNLRRTAASTFMVALIIGYSVTIIGSIASTTDFMSKTIGVTVGADASVWVFEGEEPERIMEKISELEGVIDLSFETHFAPDSSLGIIPVRAIDPLDWSKVAFMEEGWIDDPNTFKKMEDMENAGIMEKGAAATLGMSVNSTLLVKMQSKIFSIKIIDLFGKDPSEVWVLQNPTVYVNDGFLKNVKEKFIEQRRILVDLEQGVDPVWFKETVESLDPDVERVDMSEIYKENTFSNVYLAGPRRVEELGTYFAAIVASIGIVLVVSTLIRSRIKEFTIMSIRGYSPRQLAISLLVDNLGMDFLAILLGLVVGYVSLVGSTEIFNATLMVGITRRVVFPLSAKLRLSIIIGLLLAATIIPILVAVYRISKNPDLKLEE